MQPNFELNHLKYFYFTVLEGGVTPASKRLCVQQPVVSKMIKSLEEQFGEPLFWKNGRRKTLTDFGQLLYRHCQNIFQELNKVGQLKANGQEISGVLNLAAAEPVASTFLPPAIAHLIQEFPNLNTNIHTATSSHLLNLISEKQLDIGFFFHIPPLKDNLEIIKNIPTRFRLVIKKTERRKVSVIESFIGSREIDDTSTHKFPTVELMRQKYPNTRIVLSSNHLGFHKNMVLKGIGVSILPDVFVKNELQSGELADLYPKEKFIFNLKVVKRKGDRCSKVEQNILERLL